MQQQKEQETYGKIETFAELSIATGLKKNLDRAQFITPTPIQAGTILPALDGRDILGTAQTGTGKTLAFLLPIVERLAKSRSRGVEALILVPTRELAIQALETFHTIAEGANIPSALVVGGLAESRQLQAIRRGARIVIATPGRLNDYIDRKLVDLKSVTMFVLDEADRMVDMGFLPQVRSIMNMLPASRQTMCFSATMEPPVAKLIHEYMNNLIRVEIGSTREPAELVTLQAYKVPQEQKFPLLLHLLKTEKGTFLVFTRTKHGADKLFRKLIHSNIDAAVIHGNKTQPQRARALEGFKAGHHRVLVATDVAARGIHVDGIAHVVNFDFPGQTEDFIHRVGRTGRVEMTGVATTFVLPEEAQFIRNIEWKLNKQIERLELPENLPSESPALHTERSYRPRATAGRPQYRTPSRVGVAHRGGYQRGR